MPSSNYKLIKTYLSHQEIVQDISKAYKENNFALHPGQAFCNAYLKDGAIWPELYYLEGTIQQAAMIVLAHVNEEG